MKKGTRHLSNKAQIEGEGGKGAEYEGFFIVTLMGGKLVHELRGNRVMLAGLAWVFHPCILSFIYVTS